jgi:hypothetical protein
MFKMIKILFPHPREETVNFCEINVLFNDFEEKNCNIFYLVGSGSRIALLKGRPQGEEKKHSVNSFV